MAKASKRTRRKVAMPADDRFDPSIPPCEPDGAPADALDAIRAAVATLKAAGVFSINFSFDTAIDTMVALGVRVESWINLDANPPSPRLWASGDIGGVDFWAVGERLQWVLSHDEHEKWCRKHVGDEAALAAEGFVLGLTALVRAA